MQNQNLLREKQQYRTNFLSSFFVVLPLLVFAASSAYSVLALWRAKSLQALAAPEIQKLPFGMWVGNDITWAMKFAILSAGYFSLLLAYAARKQLWQNKVKLGILILLGAAQALLCLDYIAKLQWFADDGVTAKGLVIIGFTAINAFLLALLRGYIKERVAVFLTVPIISALPSAFASRISKTCSFLFWDYPSQLWQKHRQTLLFLGGSFLFVLLIYGSKIFFTSYVTDDYGSIFSARSNQMTGVGRWSADILNNSIFWGPRRVLPYFNMLWGLFVLVLSAYLTARIWDAKSRKIQFGIICLASITPYIAHNLSFNINVSVPLGLLAAVLSFYLLVKNICLAPVSILLAAFAVGIYQSTIQILLVIWILWFFQQLATQKLYKSFLLHFFLIGIVICLSYLLSNAINDAILSWQKRPSVSLYALTKEPSFIDILQNAIQLLQRKPLPNLYLAYFYPKLQGLLYFLFGLTAIYMARFGLLKFILFILGAIVLQVVVELPLLFNIGPSTRAYMHMGWLIAGFFALLQQSKRCVFALFSRFICILIFLFSALYVSQFYDSTMRQTENDIRQANQIVNRIRLMPEYHSEEEAIPFIIFGTKRFAVAGQKLFQQALNTDWSKYPVFQYFTDFNYRHLNAQEEEQIRNKLAARENLANYPGKGSILFIDGMAVLILDKSKLTPPTHNTQRKQVKEE